MRKAPRIVLIAMLAALAASGAHAATCLADYSPNGQPANSQSVPPEFCIAGAAGQHYYLWNIPAVLSGRSWTVKLESRPGEDTRLVVQSLDHNPHKGPFLFRSLWQGANTAASSNITSPPLSLKPGLYGIVVATRQVPGLYRLFVANQKTPSPNPSRRLGQKLSPTERR